MPLKKTERQDSAASTKALTTENVEEEASMYFGCWGCHPKCLQILANAKFFTFILCVFSLIEGATVSGFTSVVISSIERRYRFSSTAASLIVSSFDIAVVLSVVFVSYFGEKGHKPRWLGVSFIVEGVGTIVFALPHFIFGKYDPSGSGELFTLESCADNMTYAASCDPGNSVAYAFFVVGNILIGLGATPLFITGVSYLDDIVHPKYVSIHLGIFFAMSIVGPAIGFGVGGGLLTIYVDPLEDTTLTQFDPAWVGAWWLGFIMAGILCFIGAIPFFMFPRLLPESNAIKEARMKETAKTYTSKYGEEKKLSHVIKAFPIHLWKLVKNPTWFCTTLSVTCLFFSFDGIVAFAPKYFESQYYLTSSTASIVAGAVAIPSGGVGVIVGAVILYCMKAERKKKGKKAALVIWLAASFALLPLFTLLAYCPTDSVAGINMNYATSSNGRFQQNLTASCNIECECTSTVYEPVCGADGITYFSPCRAGCDKQFTEGEEPSLDNCSCVSEGPLASNHSGASLPTADIGQCDRSCTVKLFIFIIGVISTALLIFTERIPIVILTMRCVADEQRTFALGVQSVIFRAFGSVPGPIVFGVLFDRACIYWQEECGRRGNCWIYNNKTLATNALIAGVVGLFLSIIFSFLAWLLYPKSKNVTLTVTELEEPMPPPLSSGSPQSSAPESSDETGGKVGVFDFAEPDEISKVGSWL